MQRTRSSTTLLSWVGELTERKDIGEIGEKAQWLSKMPCRMGPVLSPMFKLGYPGGREGTAAPATPRPREAARPTATMLHQAGCTDSLRIIMAEKEAEKIQEIPD